MAPRKQPREPQKGRKSPPSKPTSKPTSKAAVRQSKPPKSATKRQREAQEQATRTAQLNANAAGQSTALTATRAPPKSRKTPAPPPAVRYEQIESEEEEEEAQEEEIVPDIAGQAAGVEPSAEPAVSTQDEVQDEEDIDVAAAAEAISDLTRPPAVVPAVVSIVNQEPAPDPDFKIVVKTIYRINEEKLHRDAVKSTTRFEYELVNIEEDVRIQLSTVCLEQPYQITKRTVTAAVRGKGVGREFIVINDFGVEEDLRVGGLVHSLARKTKWSDVELTIDLVVICPTLTATKKAANEAVAAQMAAMNPTPVARPVVAGIPQTPSGLDTPTPRSRQRNPVARERREARAAIDRQVADHELALMMFLRCSSDSCPNKDKWCYIDDGLHYAVDSTLKSKWAELIEQGRATQEEPTRDLHKDMIKNGSVTLDRKRANILPAAEQRATTMASRIEELQLQAEVRRQEEAARQANSDRRMDRYMEFTMASAFAASVPTGKTSRNRRSPSPSLSPREPKRRRTPPESHTFTVEVRDYSPINYGMDDVDTIAKMIKRQKDNTANERSKTLLDRFAEFLAENQWDLADIKALKRSDSPQYLFALERRMPDGFLRKAPVWLKELKHETRAFEATRRQAGAILLQKFAAARGYAGEDR